MDKPSLYMYALFNISGAETGKFRDNWVNTTDFESLYWSPATMVLTTHDKQLCSVFHNELLQLLSNL